VITKNEEANIGPCLDALAFCDERIVVDAGSSDRTVAIAEQKGARVVAHAWQGFGAQKSFALSLAQGDWVLSIDADERVSGALGDEIKRAVAEGHADGYEIPRLSSFVDATCAIRAGFRTMCCGSFGAARPASPTTSCTSG
jgi:glycosyltransferase involved in cell wall biosynthesis